MCNRRSWFHLGVEILIAVLFLGVAGSRADETCYMSTPSGYRGMGGGSQLGPYSSRSQCEDVNKQYFSGNGSCSCTSSTSSSGGGVGPNAAMIQSMAPALQNLFTPIGQALANALFGNPQQEQQRLQQMQQLQAQEAARRAEEERRRAAERKRKLEEVHQRLLSGLKGLDTDGAFADLPEKSLDDINLGGKLAPKGLDDATLAPSGTSFFGLGGGALLLNPVNVRRAAYLAAVAINAPPGDAQVLLDEALRVAEGATPFVQIPDNKLPVINEDGLRAFQQANIDYRNAHSDNGTVSQQLAEAQQKRDAAAEALRRLPGQRDALAQIGKLQEDLITQQLQASLRRFQEEAEKSLQQLRYTEDSVAWTDSMRRLALRALADRDPFVNDLLKRDRYPLSSAFQTRLRDAYELYFTGSTPEEKLRGKAALEKARQDAVEDLKRELKTASAAWLAKEQEVVREAAAHDDGWTQGLLASIEGNRLPDPALRSKSMADLRPGDILLLAPAKDWSQALPPADRLYRTASYFSSGEIFHAAEVQEAPVSHALTYVKDVGGQQLFLDHTHEGSRVLDMQQYERLYGERAVYVARPEAIVDGQKLWQAAREAALHSTGWSYGVLPGQVVCSERAAVVVAQATGLDISSHRLGVLDVTPGDFFDQQSAGKYFTILPIGGHAATSAR